MYNYLFIFKRIHLSDQSLVAAFTDACIHMHALSCVFIDVCIHTHALGCVFIDVCIHARLYIVTRDHVILFYNDIERYYVCSLLPLWLVERNKRLTS